METKSHDYTSVFFSQKAFKDLITQVHVALKLSGIHMDTEKGWPPALITIYHLPERESCGPGFYERATQRATATPCPEGTCGR